MPKTIETYHLLPYVKHELKVQLELADKVVVETLVGVTVEEGIYTSIGSYSNFLCKPILKHLADMDALAKDCLSVTDKDLENPLDLPYRKVMMLCMLHYDVFGLINAGLAINVKTLP